MITHPGARYAGPGLAGRRHRPVPVRAPAATGRACWTTSTRSPSCRRGAEFHRVLVPMKLGAIGEEMVATAIALAKERDASVEAVFVVRVPRALPARGRRCLRTSSPSGRVAGGGARARRGQRRRGRDGQSSAPARSATRSSTKRGARDVDLIVLGSSPRWRRQSRFFSPDRRPCPAQRALRGARRRLPRGRLRGGAA